MHYLIYVVFRAFTGLIEALPLGLVYRLGEFFGIVAYYLLPPYRTLAVRNLAIAVGAKK